MDRKKIYRKILFMALIITLVTSATFYVYYLKGQIPEQIRIVVGKEEDFNFSMSLLGMPLLGEGDFTSVGAMNLNKKRLEGQIKMDFSQPFSLKAERTGEVIVRLKIIGLIPIQEIRVNVVQPQEVIPCGMPIGIYVETNGLLVLGTGEIRNSEGEIVEPAKNILQTGDYILAINGEEVESTKELKTYVEKSEGQTLVLNIRRNKQESKVKVVPTEDENGICKAGIWVRDSTQGIGTLTYVTMEEEYAALGHGITDVDTGLLMEIEKGYLYRAKVLTISKGVAGTPGELIGVINKTQKNKIGYIETNTVNGITGALVSDVISEFQDEPIPIGYRQDVSLGKAYVRSYVSGQAVDYEIEIEELEEGKGESGRGMVIRVTDERLLELTGGIVQGMSGSPVIQNGRIVGAVTHVLVNDPTRGYGIFIENMLEAAK